MSPVASFIIYAFICLAIACGGMVIACLCSPRKPNAAKDESYECSSSLLVSPKKTMNTSLYAYCLVFLIFDIAMIFLIPWAASLSQSNISSLLNGLFFMIIIAAVFVYLLRRGIFDEK